MKIQILKHIIRRLVLLTLMLLPSTSHTMLKNVGRTRPALEEAASIARSIPKDRRVAVGQPLRCVTTAHHANYRNYARAGQKDFLYKALTVGAAAAVPVILYFEPIKFVQCEAKKLYADYFKEPTHNIYHAIPKVSTTCPLNFGGLLEDMSLYLTTNIKWHQGNLYEHSIWVAKCMEEWFAQNHQWVEGITDEKTKKIAVIAGFLHDIGKAGAPEGRIFYNKHDHPHDGMKYLLGKRPYTMVESGTPFDFKEYFKHIQKTYNLDEEDIKKIIFLVGAHYTFGAQVLKPMHRHCLKYYNKNIHAKEKEKIAAKMNQLSKRFMQDLKQIAQEVGIKQVDTNLVRLAILIGAADLYGSGEVSADSVIILGINNIDAPHFFDAEKKEPLPKSYTSPYERKEVAKNGAFARRWILEEFKEK